MFQHISLVLELPVLNPLETAILLRATYEGMNKHTTFLPLSLAFVALGSALRGIYS